MPSKFLRAFLVAAALLVPCSLLAQSTTVVSGTIVDPNGVPWGGASITANLSASATVTVNNQGQCISAGLGNAPCQMPVQGTWGPAIADATGKFTMSLFSNSGMTPNTVQYIFSVIAVPVLPPWGTGPQAFTDTLTITGATQNVSTSFNALAKALTQATGSSSISGCTTAGGVLYQSGTNNKATCGPLFVWDTTNNLIELNGSTSGQAEIGVNPVAGTPNKAYLPTLTANAGQYLASDGANPQNLTWRSALGPVIDTTSLKYNTPIGQTIPDATFANGQNTIDCTFTNDCNFVAATDNGKICFGTNYTTDVSAVNPGTSVILPEGTLTVTDAQHATCSGGNATASTTHNGLFAWGNDGASALNTAWTDCLANNGCTFILPAAPVLVEAAGVGIANCASANNNGPCVLGVGYSRIQVRGWGESTSILIPTPNYASTNCTGGISTSTLSCFFGGAGITYQDFGIFGAGQSVLAAGFNGKVILYVQGNSVYNSYLDNVMLLSWGTKTTGMIGWQATNNSMAVFQNVIVDGGGAIACKVAEVTQVPVTLEGSQCATTLTTSLSITAGQVASHGSYYGFFGSAVNCTASGASMDSTGDIFFNNLPIFGSGCNAHLRGLWTNEDIVEVTGSGTTVTVEDSIEAGGAVAAFFCNGSGSRIINRGGNVITPGGSSTFILNTVSGCEYDDDGTSNFSAGTGSPNVNSGTIGGSNDLSGSCTGTVTSATTVGLYRLGEQTATTCTVAVTNLGQVMERTGKIFGLACTAGTGGNQTADACTVVKNGSAQSMTCSLNGVTRCTDLAQTHWVSFAKGDVISIEVIGGTSTTLANVTGDVWRGI